jgi:uncharacterized membrane protein (Fun14 family)
MAACPFSFCGVAMKTVSKFVEFLIATTITLCVFGLATFGVISILIIYWLFCHVWN